MPTTEYYATHPEGHGRALVPAEPQREIDPYREFLSALPMTAMTARQQLAVAKADAEIARMYRARTVPFTAARRAYTSTMLSAQAEEIRWRCMADWATQEQFLARSLGGAR